MAGASLLTLIDDIASVLDDVSTMTKVAAKQTAGVLGDDLALNVEQVTGVRAEREIPVVIAVAKGSLRNKAILVPAAILISLIIPWAITPLLMIGGAFLCFEGAEKLMHKWLHNTQDDREHHKQESSALNDKNIDIVEYEKTKIAGAIRTDFILSAEIITLTLGIVADSTILTQAIVVSLIAVVMTIGVYGVVAGLVKIDDLGLHLFKSKNASVSQKKIGLALVNSAPALMKFLSIAGTVAMFLVGGGILVHGVPVVHHLFEHWAEQVSLTSAAISWSSHFVLPVLNGFSGVIAGAVLVVVIERLQKLKGKMVQ